MFDLVSKYKPSGDQPSAIEKLVKGINEGRTSTFRCNRYRKNIYNC